MLRKIIDGRSLEISQENVYEGVPFSKVTNIQCSDATLLLRQLITDTFWNMYPKLAILKNKILRKKSMTDKLLNKVATLQYTALSFMKKNEAHVRLSCRPAESSNIFTGKCLWWRLFSTKGATLEFIPAISLKRDSNTEAFPYGFFTVILFKLLENFLRDIFAKHFLTKSQASNLQVATLLEITCLTKIYRTSF